MPRREQALGTGNDELLRFAADLRLLRAKAGSPPYRALAARTHYSASTLSEATSGRKLPSLAVTMALAEALGGHLPDWRERWHALSSAATPPPTTTAAPYVGLAPFQQGDADRFFGRDQVVAELVVRVSERRVVAVFGASGVGKSSVLRAGLLAALPSDRTAVLFTPGARPLEECAIQLAALTNTPLGEARVELDADARGLHRLVRQSVVGRPAHDELVIVVDQFEEIFTLCHDEAERTRFIDLLLTAATAPDSACRVVLGVRADFYGHCTTHPGLLAALADAQLALGPMTTDELREAVTRPATGAGLAVETALVSRLVADATGQPGVLPLFSHALLETWRRRKGNSLTLLGYEAAGSIERAVANTAEQAFQTLTEHQKLLARQVFLRLTAPGEGTEDTKRRVRRTELDPDVDPVLERLVEARLLTLDRDGVEIAHEALIRSWPRLRGWLAADRDGLRVHRQLTEATDGWEALDRDSDALYRGARLTLAQEWADRSETLLTTREREFLDASTEADLRTRTLARKRTRRLRQLVALLSVLLVATVATTAYAVNAEIRTTHQRNTALAQNAATQASALRELNPVLAAQLSLASYRLEPTVDSRSSLLSAFARPYATKLPIDGAPFNDATFSPDGKVLATGGDDNAVTLWDVSRPHHPTRLATTADIGTNVESLDFDADGTTVLVAGYDGRVRTLDVRDPRAPVERATATAHTRLVYKADFAPHGKLVATASDDGTAQLWDFGGGAPVRLASLAGHDGPVFFVAFSPDGKLVVTAGDDRTVRVWDVTSPTTPRQVAVLEGHTDAVQSAAFSPDGKVLATAGYDRTARLWDLTTMTQLTVLQGAHTDSVQSVAISPDGRTLSTSSWDHTTKLWDITDPASAVVLQTLTNHTNLVWSAEFSPDGRTLVTAGTDRSVLLTEVPGPVLASHAGAVHSASFAPGGELAAIGSLDGTASLWDVTDRDHPRRLSVLPGHTATVWSVSFTPDGRHLATGSLDRTVRLWDVANPSHPVLVASIAEGTSIRVAQFSPDGTLLATSGDSHVVRLYDTKDVRAPVLLSELADHTDFSPSVAFSPDGGTLAIAMSQMVRLNDITDPRSPRLVGKAEGHSDRVLSVAFAPDGRGMATASLDRTARLWDLANPATPTPTARLTGHNGAVWSLAYSPDGTTLATGSLDRTTRLWDSRTSQPLATLLGHTDRVRRVAFAADGHTLLSVGDDRVGRLWNIDPETVAARVCDRAHPRITESERQTYFPGVTDRGPCD